MLTHFLINKFVKDPENTTDTAVRTRYGTLSSFVGIFCNIILFFVKFLMGTLSGSISIISDAFNNLSDSANCIITFLGYKLAAKPADKDHPYGHGRLEYLTTLIISVLICMVGLSLLKDSLKKIFDPSEITFKWIVLVSLIFSIAVKLWMSFFNDHLGKKIASNTLLATATDSRNDCIATLSTIIALIGSRFTDLPLDGIMGLLVSVLILKAGIDIIRDTLDELLGKPAEPEMLAMIKEIVQSNPRILSLHDLIIHNYGPGKLFGSCHVEVRCDEDLLTIHDIIDNIERELYEKLSVLMTIHMDPVEVNNQALNDYRKKVAALLSSLDEKITFHDFRMVNGPTHTNLIFDIVIPFDCKYKKEDILSALDTYFQNEPTKLFFVIQFDQPIS